MTTGTNNRLSSATFLITFTALAGWVTLRFFVPHLEMRWHDEHQALTALQQQLISASRATDSVLLAAVLVGLFAVAIAWRVVAVKQLRESKQAHGFTPVG